MKNSEKTILLVDDEPNILLPLEFIVKKEGYKTLTARNGREALVIMENTIPDIVVLDVMMPELDGFQTAKEIRENPQWENVRIIFLTAKGTSADKLSGYASGGDIYLTKPFDNDKLLNSINEIAEFGY